MLGKGVVDVSVASLKGCGLAAAFNCMVQVLSGSRGVGIHAQLDVSVALLKGCGLVAAFNCMARVWLKGCGLVAAYTCSVRCIVFWWPR